MALFAIARRTHRGSSASDRSVNPVGPVQKAFLERRHKTHNRQQASHIRSAEMLKYYHIQDSYDNYRMKSIGGNQITDRYAEKNIIAGGGFRPGYRTYNGETRYVSNQDCIDKIEQMLKLCNNNTPKMLLRDMYRAARDAGGDLRMFNGYHFYRPH